MSSARASAASNYNGPGRDTKCAIDKTIKDKKSAHEHIAATEDKQHILQLATSDTLKELNNERERVEASGRASKAKEPNVEKHSLIPKETVSSAYKDYQRMYSERSERALSAGSK